MTDFDPGSGWTRWPCPLCGEERSKAVFCVDTCWENGPKTYSIVRCAVCSLHRCLPLPPADERNRFYSVFDSHDLVATHEGWIVGAARKVLDTFDSLLPERGKMLDVGCGCGLLLDEARGRGWDAVGVDSSQREAERARERFGFEIVVGDMNERMFPAAHFDAINVSHVIEHLPAPVTFMEGLKRLLKDHGVIHLSTPNSASLLAWVLQERFNYWIPPLHLTVFNPSSMRFLLRRTNLREIRVGSTGTDFDGCLFLRNRTGLPERMCRTASRAAAAVLESVLPLRGSILEVYAGKRTSLEASDTS